MSVSPFTYFKCGKSLAAHFLTILTVSAAKKKHFQMMRKMHYNEGLNIKLARQLIASELEEDEDEDEEMRDDTEEAREDVEETEEISVDPPQEGKKCRLGP